MKIGTNDMYIHNIQYQGIYDDFKDSYSNNNLNTFMDLVTIQRKKEKKVASNNVMLNNSSNITIPGICFTYGSQQNDYEKTTNKVIETI